MDLILDFLTLANALPRSGCFIRNAFRNKDMFEQFATDAGKNVKAVQRTRRENVTEMILEPVRDFTRAPYCEECAEAGTMTFSDALTTANRLVDRAERYYTEAAAKIKAQPEVSRALKTICKKHKAHREKLSSL